MDASKLIESLLAGAGGQQGGQQGSGGGLGGLLGGLAKIGGVAALGYLAHNALKNWQAGQGQAAPQEAPDPRKMLAAPSTTAIRSHSPWFAR